MRGGVRAQATPAERAPVPWRGRYAVSRSKQDFVSASMRHFAVLRNREGAAHASDGVAGGGFPPDWFDLGPETLADFGAMYYLMALSKFNRDRSLAAITAQLEPPLRLGQYRIFRSGGFARAFITWAGLDPARERKLAVDHLPLRPEDWNSGNSKWVVDLVAPFGHVEQVLEVLRHHPDETRLRTLWHNKAGTRARVMQWSREKPGAPIVLKTFGAGQFAKLLAEA